MSSIKRRLFYMLPPSMRFAVRWLYYLPQDIYESSFTSQHHMRPPRRLTFTGAGDFLRIGHAFVEDFKVKKLVRQDSAILDVGSGIGRLAIPLTGLIREGRYEGFDIMSAGVEWCKRHIAASHPQFRFQQVQLSNDLYRNEGEAADHFVFPYADDTFDFAMVISVFTHMVPKELQQYIAEIGRVLQKGGHCYATFFLLNEQSRSTMDQHGFTFPHAHGHYSLMDEKVKSANVAYDEQHLLQHIIDQSTFDVISIEYGSWSHGNSKSPIDFQDRIVIRKK
jgi:SAM-dependent methyltransferase